MALQNPNLRDQMPSSRRNELNKPSRFGSQDIRKEPGYVPRAQDNFFPATRAGGPVAEASGSGAQHFRNGNGYAPRGQGYVDRNPRAGGSSNTNMNAPPGVLADMRQRIAELQTEVDHIEANGSRSTIIHDMEISFQQKCNVMQERIDATESTRDFYEEKSRSLEAENASLRRKFQIR